MSTVHEEDYQRRVVEVGATRFLDDTTVEVVREVRLASPPKFAVFDFDGTLSLVREGWPEVMLPMMVDELVATGTKESPESLGKIVRDFINELTGKQTIYQMIRLAEEVAKRGGHPHEPIVYKHRYHDLLMQRIASRRDALLRENEPAGRYACTVLSGNSSAPRMRRRALSSCQRDR